MTEHGTDFIVSELLSELKNENSRKESQIKGLYRVIAAIVVGALVTVLLTIAGFLWYLNQYDFSATETITNSAEGVYAIVDSEGNIISSDLTSEEVANIVGGYINGESN